MGANYPQLKCPECNHYLSSHVQNPFGNQEGFQCGGTDASGDTCDCTAGNLITFHPFAVPPTIFERSGGEGLRVPFSYEQPKNLTDYAKECHEANKRWWTDLQTGHYPIDRNMGQMLMLCVSEIAEAMEGHRKDLKDDKLPHRDMLDVELVDCFIRIADIMGARNIDFEAIYREKMEYNAKREDHKIENRKQAGGKKY